MHARRTLCNGPPCKHMEGCGYFAREGEGETGARAWPMGGAVARVRLCLDTLAICSANTFLTSPTVVSLMSKDMACPLSSLLSSSVTRPVPVRLSCFTPCIIARNTQSRPVIFKPSTFTAFTFTRGSSPHRPSTISTVSRRPNGPSAAYPLLLLDAAILISGFVFRATSLSCQLFSNLSYVHTRCTLPCLHTRGRCFRCGHAQVMCLGGQRFNP